MNGQGTAGLTPGSRISGAMSVQKMETGDPARLWRLWAGVEAEGFAVYRVPRREVAPFSEEVEARWLALDGAWQGRRRNELGSAAVDRIGRGSVEDGRLFTGGSPTRVTDVCGEEIGEGVCGGGGREVVGLRGADVGRSNSENWGGCGGGRGIGEAVEAAEDVLGRKAGEGANEEGNEQMDSRERFPRQARLLHWWQG
jgi:hypothetical protein